MSEIDTIEAADYIAWTEKPKRRKYANQPTEVDGIRFDSLAEARRYDQLLVLEAAGEISQLAIHPRFPIIVNGVKITRYTADFSYFDRTGALIVEDVKGGQATKTRAYVIRKKLLKALYGISITEVEQA